MTKEITSYIKNLLGTGYVIGTNIFAGFVPSTIEGDCIIVIDSGGLPNFYIPDHVEKTVQVICRAEDYHDAMSRAMLVFRALNGKAGITLPVVVTEGWYVNTITAISLPQNVGQDERGLFNISTNYVFKMQDA
jgi:hypothetical protein